MNEVGQIFANVEKLRLAFQSSSFAFDFLDNFLVGILNEILEFFDRLKTLRLIGSGQSELDRSFNRFDRQTIVKMPIVRTTWRTNCTSAVVHDLAST